MTAIFLIVAEAYSETNFAFELVLRSWAQLHRLTGNTRFGKPWTDRPTLPEVQSACSKVWLYLGKFVVCSPRTCNGSKHRVNSGTFRVCYFSPRKSVPTTKDEINVPIVLRAFRDKKACHLYSQFFYNIIFVQKACRSDSVYHRGQSRHRQSHCSEACQRWCKCRHRCQDRRAAPQTTWHYLFSGQRRCVIGVS